MHKIFKYFLDYPKAVYRVHCEPSIFYNSIFAHEYGKILGPYSGWLGYTKAWYAANLYISQRPFGKASIEIHKDLK